MPENLVQHRGEPNVWEGSGRRGPLPGDAGRWIAAATAGALLLGGIRRRTTGGLLAALAGGGLAWWAAGARDGRGGWLSDVCGWGRREEDAVNEAAEESFPASDAPALTPASSVGGRASVLRAWPFSR